MNSNEIATYILGACKSLALFEAYMFGSTLFGVGADIDILIVGPSGEALSQLKSEIKIAGKNLPLDVLYMQPSEARHTDFVTKQKCVPLLHLASQAKYCI